MIAVTYFIRWKFYGCFENDNVLSDRKKEREREREREIGRGRERERERDVYMYIYIYRERERALLQLHICSREIIDNPVETCVRAVLKPNDLRH